MANIHTADRYDIDAGMESIRKANAEFKTRKADALKVAHDIAMKRDSKVHSHTYNKMDSAILSSNLIVLII